jgi:hypothetical protein
MRLLSKFFWQAPLVALVLLLTGCVVVPPAPLPPVAESAPGFPARTIVVVGNGQMRVQANVAQINFGVEFVDENVATANRDAAAMMDEVLASLASLDIAEADIKPQSYNIYSERYYPDYERADPGTVPLFPETGESVRYRVTHQIYVVVRDPAKLTTILDTLVTVGGGNVYIYNSDFLYDNPRSLERAARTKAVADAQRKATDTARLLGVELGPVIAISELVQGSYVGVDSFSSTLWPGQLQFYMQLQITYRIVDQNADTLLPGISPNAPLTNTIAITP